MATHLYPTNSDDIPSHDLHCSAPPCRLALVLCTQPRPAMRRRHFALLLLITSSFGPSLLYIYIFFFCLGVAWVVLDWTAKREGWLPISLLIGLVSARQCFFSGRAHRARAAFMARLVRLHIKGHVRLVSLNVRRRCRSPGSRRGRTARVAVVVVHIC